MLCYVNTWANFIRNYLSRTGPRRRTLEKHHYFFNSIINTNVISPITRKFADAQFHREEPFLQYIQFQKS